MLHVRHIWTSHVPCMIDTPWKHNHPHTHPHPHPHTHLRHAMSRDTYTNTHTHTHTLSLSLTHTHAHTQTHTHTHADTDTDTDTHRQTHTHTPASRYSARFHKGPHWNISRIVSPCLEKISKVSSTVFEYRREQAFENFYFWLPYSSSSTENSQKSLYTGNWVLS